ncbi:Major royal jelly protein [Popillia japonica]|uniref:Major royal jelly protein n=1 Tax=Popillia japonica TaxID=7064 RepID=A0AAW1HWS5_POPJA
MANNRTATNVRNILPYLLSLGLLTNNNLNYPTNHKKDVQKHVETTGPFKTWYRWKEIDFAFESDFDRISAIENGGFIPENNLPLGLEVYKDRLFISLPKWKPGVPASLTVLPKVPVKRSPLLVPYPNWNWHAPGSCSRITSVFRMQADVCGRLWVLDSGQIDVTIGPKQICPPQVLIFDLHTDKLLHRYELPKEFIKEDGLFSNIAVDIRHSQCDEAHAYLADVWRFGLVVYSLKTNRSWRITDHLFFPEPLAAAYNLNGLEFEWTDGLFGLALAPYDQKTRDRLLYFHPHPMSSFRQFYTKTSVILNETGWQDYKDAFKVVGESRGPFGHVSASGMDRNGILFYNMVTRNAVGCWDSKKAYKKSNLYLIAKNNNTLVFPNDLKLDQEPRQSVWILSNRLPIYLYRKLNKKQYNFRVMSAYADEAVEDTVCDTKVQFPGSYVDVTEDCY